jgi:hypothetical protein
LEILAEHRYGEIESSNEVADFVRRGGSARNKFSIAYFGLKGNYKKYQLLIVLRWH